MTDALPAPRPLLVAFVVVALAQVVSVAAGVDWLGHLTKPFIVGLLLAWAWVACDRRPPTMLATGLVFALLGDELLDLDGTGWFLAGMGAFLAMQVCYVRGFVGLGALERLRRTPWALVAWGALWLMLNVVLGPSLGALRWPIAVYSLALVTMAAMAAATGVGRIAVGGAVFLVSDLLIGLDSADVAIPASGVLVMSTYSLAQYLIVTGWVCRVRDSSRSRSERPAAIG